ncbi:MAG: IS1595 family transposase [Gemmatimonadetes bacterium]|nr:IS1595 family transposase [Gemmatimonadota bacterium]MCY3943610.1 IS1595 family transposase [Gemmatimonadota bacterium]
MRDVNLMTLMDRFNCDQKCRDTLEAIRWPNGVACLRCGSLDVTEIASRHQFRCTEEECRYRFSVTAGTIMHRSHLPLRKWFVAICLVCQSKKGVSANQLKRMLGVQYRTAWHLCHRIREAMGNDPLSGPTLVGIVEMDQTMVGGRARKGMDWHENKTWVAGAIERGGRVRIERIPNIRKKTIHDFVARNISDAADAIYTDELRSHVGLETGTRRHESVNHSADEWVVGDVHTKSVEGVWSLFKRSIVGSFHKMSVKHMDRYLEELEWRFNNRDNPYIFRDALRRIMCTEPLEYRRLVDGEAA